MRRPPGRGGSAPERVRGAAAPEPARAAARFAAAAVIIDLDGTLLDTAADLAAAVNAMLVQLGHSPLPVARVAEHVGKGAEVLVHRALTDSPEGRVPAERFEPAHRAFLEHYRRENGRNARVYPGVVEGLEAMRAMGLRLAVVTNKPSAFTGPLLEQCGLARFFDLVVSGDSLPRKKPDPLPMRHVCETFGLPPSQVVAIGDSMNDAIAARAAGLPVFVVPYGYNEGRDVRSLEADAIVSTLLEAAELIEPVA
ncbi:MAG TPA: phosphoglycolate phosphatase [Quisquiliibacterium sp.]|nr:phosphoglycolate phosphatase [Quisquiliibacterium sp.]